MLSSLVDYDSASDVDEVLHSIDKKNKSQTSVKVSSGNRSSIEKAMMHKKILMGLEERRDSKRREVEVDESSDKDDEEFRGVEEGEDGEAKEKEEKYGLTQRQWLKETSGVMVKDSWELAANRAKELLGYESEDTRELSLIHDNKNNTGASSVSASEAAQDDDDDVDGVEHNTDDISQQVKSGKPPQVTISLAKQLKSVSFRETSNQIPSSSDEHYDGNDVDISDFLCSDETGDESDGRDRHISFAYSSLRDSDDEHFNRAIMRLSSIFKDTFNDKKGSQRKKNARKSLRKIISQRNLSITKGIDLKQYLKPSSHEAMLDSSLDSASGDSVRSEVSMFSDMTDGTWGTVAPAVQTRTQKEVSFSKPKPSQPSMSTGGWRLPTSVNFVIPKLPIGDSPEENKETSHPKKQKETTQAFIPAPGRELQDNHDIVERLFEEVAREYADDPEMAQFLKENPKSEQAQKMLSSDKSSERSRPLSEREWDDLVERMMRPFERRERKVEELRQQRERKEMEACRFRPKINKRSKKLAQQNAPLVERREVILKERESKIETQRHEKQQQEVSSATFSPKINAKSKRMQRGTHSFEQWLQERERKREEKAEDSKRMEVEGCTFQPTLSRRSKKIMERKGQGTTVVDRNMEFVARRTQKLLAKLEQGLNDNRTPRITRLASRLQRTEPVGDRLYKLAMESMTRKEEMFRRRHFKRDVDYYDDFDDDDDDEYDESDTSGVSGSRRSRGSSRRPWRRRKRAERDGVNLLTLSRKVDSEAHNPNEEQPLGQQQARMGYEADEEYDMNRRDVHEMVPPIDLNLLDPPQQLGKLGKSAVMLLKGESVVQSALENTEDRMYRRKELLRQRVRSAAVSRRLDSARAERNRKPSPYTQRLSNSLIELDNLYYSEPDNELQKSSQPPVALLPITMYNTEEDSSTTSMVSESSTFMELIRDASFGYSSDSGTDTDTTSPSSSGTHSSSDGYSGHDDDDDDDDEYDDDNDSVKTVSISGSASNAATVGEGSSQTSTHFSSRESVNSTVNIESLSLINYMSEVDTDHYYYDESDTNTVSPSVMQRAKETLQKYRLSMQRISGISPTSPSSQWQQRAENDDSSDLSFDSGDDDSPS